MRNISRNVSSFPCRTSKSCHSFQNVGVVWKWKKRNFIRGNLEGKKLVALCGWLVLELPCINLLTESRWRRQERVEESQNIPGMLSLVRRVTTQIWVHVHVSCIMGTVIRTVCVSSHLFRKWVKNVRNKTNPRISHLWSVHVHSSCSVNLAQFTLKISKSYTHLSGEEEKRD